MPSHPPCVSVVGFNPRPFAPHQPTIRPPPTTALHVRSTSSLPPAPCAWVSPSLTALCVSTPRRACLCLCAFLRGRSAHPHPLRRPLPSTIGTVLPHFRLPTLNLSLEKPTIPFPLRRDSGQRCTIAVRPTKMQPSPPSIPLLHDAGFRGIPSLYPVTSGRYLFS